MHACLPAPPPTCLSACLQHCLATLPSFAFPSCHLIILRPTLHVPLTPPCLCAAPPPRRTAPAAATVRSQTTGAARTHQPDHGGAAVLRHLAGLPQAPRREGVSCHLRTSCILFPHLFAFLCSRAPPGHASCAQKQPLCLHVSVCLACTLFSYPSSDVHSEMPPCTSPITLVWVCPKIPPLCPPPLSHPSFAAHPPRIFCAPNPPKFSHNTWSSCHASPCCAMAYTSCLHPILILENICLLSASPCPCCMQQNRAGVKCEVPCCPARVRRASLQL